VGSALDDVTKVMIKRGCVGVVPFYPHSRRQGSLPRGAGTDCYPMIYPILSDFS